MFSCYCCCLADKFRQTERIFEGTDGYGMMCLSFTGVHFTVNMMYTASATEAGSQDVTVHWPYWLCVLIPGVYIPPLVSSEEPH